MTLLCPPTATAAATLECLQSQKLIYIHNGVNWPEIKDNDVSKRFGLRFLIAPGYYTGAMKTWSSWDWAGTGNILK